MLSILFFNSSLQTGIIKIDISDHFPIFVAIKNFNLSTYPSKITFLKRSSNNDSIRKFKSELAETNWIDVIQTTSTRNKYNHFKKSFSVIYDKHFAIKKLP